MCVAPLKVRNPKLRAGTFLQGVDKEFILVPCGHCPECAFQRTQQLVFRAYNEYCDTIAHDGFTLFETFTYSERNAPYSGGFIFFNPKDISKFMKRLRKRLNYDGYDVEHHLKYVCTMEYGSKHRRPHYHLLFFVTFSITPEKFQQYISLCWTTLGDRYSDTTPIGRTDKKDVKQRIINSIYGIQYVCKYITKGTSVVDAVKYKGWSDISHFVHDFCFNSKDPETGEYSCRFDDLHDWDLVKIWNAYVFEHPELKDVVLLPSYMTSKGLGLGFIQKPDFDYHDLFDVQKVPSKSKKNPFIKFQTPMYYIRKVFYRYEYESKRFILNELGREYKKHIGESVFDSYDELLKYNDSLYDDIFLRYAKTHSEVQGYTSLRQYVDACLNGRSYRVFALYCTYLQGRTIHPLHAPAVFGDGLDAVDFELFCKTVDDDCITQSIMDSVWCPTEEYLDKFDDWHVLFDGEPAKDRVGRLMPYNKLACFDMFDELSEVLAHVKRQFHVYHASKMEQDLKLYNAQKLAKSVMNEYSCVYY